MASRVALELLQEADGLNLGHGRIVARLVGDIAFALDERDVVEPVLDLRGKVHAQEARTPGLATIFRHVRDEHAALAEAGAVLHLVEAEAAEMADRAELASLVFAAKAMRRILHHHDVVLLRQLHDRIHLHRIAADVHGDDNLRLRRDLARHVGGIHVDRTWIDIRKHELRADGKRIGHRRDERVGGHDHLVAGADARIAIAHLQRGRAVGEEQRAALLHAQVGVDGLFDFAHLVAHRELAGRRRNLGELRHGGGHFRQRRVVLGPRAAHEELYQLHHVFGVVVLAYRRPRHLRVASVIPEVACFLAHFNSLLLVDERVV